MKNEQNAPYEALVDRLIDAVAEDAFGGREDRSPETNAARADLLATLSSPPAAGGAVAWQFRMGEESEWQDCSRDEYEQRRLACAHLRHYAKEWRALFASPAAPPSVTDAEMVAELRKILAIAPNASTQAPMRWAAHREMKPAQAVELLTHVVNRTVEDGYFSGEMHLIEESDSGHAIAYTGCGLKSGHNAQFLVACAHFVLRFGEALTHPGHKPERVDLEALEDDAELEDLTPGHKHAQEDAPLLDQIDALIDLDKRGKLVPHGVGGLARELLTNAAARIRALSPQAAQEDAAQEGVAEVDAFLAEVRAELVRARTKFPGDRIMTIALAEEFGELCKAILDEPAANVRKEAVQTAVMAARVVLDGDGSVNDWRRERGLDSLTTPIDSEAK